MTTETIHNRHRTPPARNSSTMKTCTKCGRVLPLEDFPIGKLNAGGRRPQCKPCYSAHTYATRNPEVCAKAQAKFYKTEKGVAHLIKHRDKNKDAREEATREWRKRQGPEGLWTRNQKYAHGLSAQQLTALCTHDPVCAVCGRNTALHTDHNHTTQQVRGRLCVRCNTAIGKLGDDLAGVMRAVRYLEERDNVTGLPWQ